MYIKLGSGNFNIDYTLLELFRIEVENHSRVLETGLIVVEAEQTPEKIEPLMRAAHSIKGAARILGLNIAVELAHAMEDILSSAQHGKITLNNDYVDELLKCNDIFKELSLVDIESIPNWLDEHSASFSELTSTLRDLFSGKLKKTKPLPEISNKTNSSLIPQPPAPVSDLPEPQKTETEQESVIKHERHEITTEKAGDPSVRVLAEHLNKLMGYAGECLVQVKSATNFSNSLLQLKKLIYEVETIREYIFQRLNIENIAPDILDKFSESSQKLELIHDILFNHTTGFENYIQKLEYITNKLYDEAVSTRMRPFSDGLFGFQRMVRDIAKSLDKKVNFIIEGSSTRIDRDILEKLEAPLTHLIRNSIDHGIESSRERIEKGKMPDGTIILAARHISGMLIISLKDDGKGLDFESIRRKVVEKNYITESVASSLSNTELSEFLFLPGFSTTSRVTEVSGRGVGLDVVFSMVHSVGGTVRVDSQPGQGTTFLLQLPLTLSVVRALLMEVDGEKYALPLSRIDRVIVVFKDDIKIIEEKQYCTVDNENIGIIDAYQVFNLACEKRHSKKYHIVIISDRLNRYGLVADKFLGERNLVVIPLDKRLGKIPNVSAGAILEDGSPVLILDGDDMVRSIDNILAHGKLLKLSFDEQLKLSSKKRILVIDDSITVREVERKLLENNGYSVTVAVDGMDGWNTLNQDKFDLVISDVDMPRMNGIDLVYKIKSDARLKNIPVMIVSYKDREEDRIKGLEAGANYYLTKSSFHDESLLRAVIDLIGE